MASSRYNPPLNSGNSSLIFFSRYIPIGSVSSNEFCAPTGLSNHSAVSLLIKYLSSCEITISLGGSITLISVIDNFVLSLAKISVLFNNNRVNSLVIFVNIQLNEFVFFLVVYHGKPVYRI